MARRKPTTPQPMFLPYTPRLLHRLFPDFTWRMPGAGSAVYLTFDDGPIPQVTPWVLDQLAAHKAQASFFCVGDNALRHPDVLAQVQAAGHTVANHTQHHLSGWHTPAADYLLDVQLCAQSVPSTLFRPPYGQMTWTQAAWLKRHFRVIMWDVLSGDYDRRLSAQQCLRHVQRHARPGSIIVMHDSLKAEPNLRYLLPSVLDFLTAQGWEMHALPQGRV